MSTRLFPAPTPTPTTFGFSRDTFVVWDMEDYSIPDNLDAYSIREKIESAIMNGCWYPGGVSFQAFFAENVLSKQLQDEFVLAGIYITPTREEPGGGKVKKFNMLLGSVIHWVKYRRKPQNLLILSAKIKTIEQDPNFCRLREALENKGFQVALAHPDSLLRGGNSIDQSESEEKGFDQSETSQTPEVVIF